MPGVPALFQLFVIFSLVVIATVLKVHLGLAAAAGGIVLALWSGLKIPAILGVVTGEIFKADTLLLLALMAGILAFASAMKKSGAMETFAKAVGEIAPSKRIAMAIAPLLIGTLPMPGGAVLSAPLVEAMDSDHEHSSGTLSAANYWFRHTLELTWPLYPAFLITASLSGVSVMRLMTLNAYVVPVLFTLGLIFILPPSRNKTGLPVKPRKNASFPRRLGSFIAGVAPLALVIGTYVCFDLAWKTVSPATGLPDSTNYLIERYLPIFLGLIAGSLFIGLGAGGFKSFHGSLSIATVKLIAMVLGIRIFSVLIGAAGLAADAATELSQAGIPPIAAVAIIPLIAGLVTGVGYGYVGLAFPIALGLVPEGGAFPREAGVVLACAFGYAGMMLSPFHVCMVVSAAHFKAGLPATIRRFALPLAIFMVIAVIYTAVLASALA